MALDRRLECLPENEGKAAAMWSLIIQTTIGPVMNKKPSKFQFPTMNQAPTRQFKVGDDFISLNTENENNNNVDKKKGDNEIDSKRKKSTSSIESDSDEKTNFAIWKKCDKYPESVYGLHLEIIDFYNYMMPLPEEEVMRNDVVQRISKLVTNIWSSAKVEVFGSFRTNLYLPSSDIDMVVFGKWEKPPLFALEKALINDHIAEAASIKVLDKAMVPIIKLIDKKTKVRVDISFNTENAVQSAEMVKTYTKEYKILPYLFLTVKHFLVQRDLNEVFTGGISSYCLLLLTVSFLQLHPRARQHNTNLGVLLMEFLELYGRNFNYQRIGIRLKNGGAYINKEALAKEKGSKEIPPVLCIEDPVTGSIDIGRSSYGVLRVRETFEYAFNVIDSALRNKTHFKVNPKSTYLSRIVSLPKGLVSYRHWIKEFFNTTFVPSHVNIPPTSVFQVTNAPTTVYQMSNSPLITRPALLPTPYSPRMNVISSQYSPFAQSNLQFTQNAFFPATTQPIIGPNNTILYPVVTTAPLENFQSVSTIDNRNRPVTTADGRTVIAPATVVTSEKVPPIVAFANPTLAPMTQPLAAQLSYTPPQTSALSLGPQPVEPPPLSTYQLSYAKVATAPPVEKSQPAKPVLSPSNRNPTTPRLNNTKPVAPATTENAKSKAQQKTSAIPANNTDNDKKPSTPEKTYSSVIAAAPVENNKPVKAPVVAPSIDLCSPCTSPQSSPRNAWTTRRSDAVSTTMRKNWRQPNTAKHKTETIVISSDDSD